MKTNLRLGFARLALIFTLGLSLGLSATTSRAATLFADGFESGEWTNYWTLSPFGAATVSANSNNPATGIYSLKISGGSSGHYHELMHSLPSGSQPTRIAWKAKSDSSSAYNTYLVAGDNNVTDNNGVFFVYFNTDGSIRVYTDLAEINVLYEVGTWYALEMIVDWTLKTCSFSVNGVFKGTVPFRSTTSTEITQIHLYNNGGSGNWDDINVDGGVLPTLVAPTNSITSPADGAWFSTSTLTVAGTATPGSTNITRVRYGLNGGGITNLASGTTNWQFFFNRSSVTNTVTVQAEDANGLLAEPVTRTYVYSGPQPVTVNIVGSGHVSPASLVGVNLIVGRSYTLVAVSNDVNSAFVAWSDNQPVQDGFTAPANNTTKNFVMQPGLALTATFTNNPFADAAGVYYGLFTSDAQAQLELVATGVDMTSSGWVRLVVDKRWNFTCQLWVNSHPATFSGRFNLNGQGLPTGTVQPYGGSSALTFVLQAGFDGTIDGNVSASNVEGENWSSPLHAVKMDEQTPFVGDYNVIIPGENPFFGTITDVDHPRPLGLGYVSVNVSSAGIVSGAGNLSDGLPIKPLASGISQNGEWPFYALVGNESTGTRVKNYRTLVCGWMQFANVNNSGPAPTVSLPSSKKLPGKTKPVIQHPAFAAVQSIFPANAPIAHNSFSVVGDNVLLGFLTWIKTPSRTLYPAGFTNQTFGVGCQYFGSAPEFPDGLALFAGGALESPLVYDAPFTGGSFNITSTNVVDRPYYKATVGQLNGRYKVPELSLKQLEYRGVYLPLFNFIGGYFIGNDQSGLFITGGSSPAPSLTE